MSFFSRMWVPSQLRSGATCSTRVCGPLHRYKLISAVDEEIRVLKTIFFLH